MLFKLLKFTLITTLMIAPLSMSGTSVYGAPNNQNNNLPSFKKPSSNAHVENHPAHVESNSGHVENHPNHVAAAPAMSQQQKFGHHEQNHQGENHHENNFHNNHHNQTNQFIYYYYPSIPYYIPYEDDNSYSSYSTDDNDNNNDNSDVSQQDTASSLPQGNWVAASDGNVPDQAIVYQQINGIPTYYCRTQYNGNMYYGSLILNQGCFIQDQTSTIHIDQYEVLISYQ